MFPAARANTTPSLTRPQMAKWREWEAGLHAVLSSGVEMLILAAAKSISPLCFLPVTQSMPFIMASCGHVPLEPQTLAAYRSAPGATPSTPDPLSLAPTVPATWVPCPLPSDQLLVLR